MDYYYKSGRFVNPVTYLCMEIGYLQFEVCETFITCETPVTLTKAIMQGSTLTFLYTLNKS